MQEEHLEVAQCVVVEASEEAVELPEAHQEDEEDSAQDVEHREEEASAPEEAAASARGVHQEVAVVAEALADEDGCCKVYSQAWRYGVKGGRQRTGSIMAGVLCQLSSSRMGIMRRLLHHVPRSTF